VSPTKPLSAGTFSPIHTRTPEHKQAVANREKIVTYLDSRQGEGVRLGEIVEATGVNTHASKAVLADLHESGLIRRYGERAGTRYSRPHAGADPDVRIREPTRSRPTATIETDERTLKLIVGQPGIRHTAIMDATDWNKSTVSHACERLLAAGKVQRVEGCYYPAGYEVPTVVPARVNRPKERIVASSPVGSPQWMREQLAAVAPSPPTPKEAPPSPSGVLEMFERLIVSERRLARALETLRWVSLAAAFPDLDADAIRDLIDDVLT
jgi:DNA-binding MarR family transcriptional regulator